MIAHQGSAEATRQVAEAPAWFQRSPPISLLARTAYFIMEFKLSEALPIYSTGRGAVSSDRLKSAGDLDVSAVGSGLLHQQGDCRRMIDKDGERPALFPHKGPGLLPISPLRQPNGNGCGGEIASPGYSVLLRASMLHAWKWRSSGRSVHGREPVTVFSNDRYGRMNASGSGCLQKQLPSFQNANICSHNWFLKNRPIIRNLFTKECACDFHL